MSPHPVAIFTRAGRRLIDVLPPVAERRAWQAFQGSHLALFRATGGRVGGRIGSLRVLMLHHTGRKSGKQRVSPLLYVEDADKLAIIASKGGDKAHPAWYLNLMAGPDTEVELPGERRAVHARLATGPERERLWSKAAEVWPDYDAYQARTDRRIPVVVLDPR